MEQKYSDLTKDSSIALRFQVLSGIVLERPNGEFEVITLTTGTKVISGDHLSLLGHAVNDCHAEILARRCFRQFLYMQIEEAVDNGKSTALRGVICHEAGGEGSIALSRVYFVRPTPLFFPQTPVYPPAEI